MDYSIKVGVFDWQGFACDGGFYPEDLPQEWRLQFYSNEFATACIDLNAWMSGEHDCETFEDLRDSFELSLAVRDESALRHAETLSSQCQLRLHALINDDAESCPLAASPLAGSSWQCRSTLWTPASTLARSSSIALLPGAQGLRQYRGWIEQWLATAPPGDRLSLWLDGANTDYKTLADCRQLVELMGF